MATVLLKIKNQSSSDERKLWDVSDGKEVFVLIFENINFCKKI
jgi:hypothetical protein